MSGELRRLNPQGLFQQSLAMHARQTPSWFWQELIARLIAGSPAELTYQYEPGQTKLLSVLGQDAERALCAWLVREAPSVTVPSSRLDHGRRIIVFRLDPS